MGASPVILEVSQYAPSPKFLSNLTTKKDPAVNVQRYGQIFLSEYFATTFLMFLVCLGCLDGATETPRSPLQSPLASGFAVTSLVAVFGHISAAHMNPAVTACFWSLGMIDIPTSVVYLVAELLGAVTGVGILRGLVPSVIMSANPGQCETNIHPEMSTISAAVFEFMITSLLIYLVCALCDIRNSAKQDSAPIKFGILITALSFAGAGLTGSSLNPARTFGPAVWNNSWSDHWVYWAGPMAAGLLIPKIYKVFFEKDLTGATEQ